MNKDGFNDARDFETILRDKGTVLTVFVRILSKVSEMEHDDQMKYLSKLYDALLEFDFRMAGVV